MKLIITLLGVIGSVITIIDFFAKKINPKIRNIILFFSILVIVLGLSISYNENPISNIDDSGDLYDNDINISDNSEDIYIDISQDTYMQDNFIFEENSSLPQMADIYYIGGDYKKVMEICLELSNSGNVNATVNLGYLYANGLGCEMDIERADLYYDRAIQSGSQKALIYKYVSHFRSKKEDTGELFKECYLSGDSDFLQYFSSFSVNDDLFEMSNEDITNYVFDNMGEWSVLYNSYCSRSPLPTFSENRWNDYLFTENKPSSDCNCDIPIYYYRVSSYSLKNSELLKETYIFLNEE